jgi:hypothetical protein
VPEPSGRSDSDNSSPATTLKVLWIFPVPNFHLKTETNLYLTFLNAACLHNLPETCPTLTLKSAKLRSNDGNVQRWRMSDYYFAFGVQGCFQQFLKP